MPEDGISLLYRTARLQRQASKVRDSCHAASAAQPTIPPCMGHLTRGPHRGPCAAM